MYLYTVNGSIVIMNCLSALWLARNKSISLHLGSRDNKLNKLNWASNTVFLMNSKIFIFPSVSKQISTDKIICVPVPEGFLMATMQWNQSALKGRKLNSFDSGFKTDLDCEQYNLMDQYCYDNAIQWYSKYFPYIAIIHTLIFLISSNFWFKFPGTSSKIEHFISILGKCLDSQWTTKALSETVCEDSDLQIPQRTVLSDEPSVMCSLNLQQSCDTVHLLGHNESSNDRVCENEPQASLCKPPSKTIGPANL